MNTFEVLQHTKTESQHGITLAINTKAGQIKSNIFVCKASGMQLNVDVENHDDIKLESSVYREDFRPPLVTKGNDNQRCFVKFGPHEVVIKCDNQGVVFDVFDDDQLDQGALDSTNLFYDEI